MGNEDYIFTILFALALGIAALETIGIFLFLRNNRNKFNLIIGILVIILNLLSSFMIITILQGAWPDASPLLMIFLSTFLCVIIYLKHRNNKQVKG